MSPHRLHYFDLNERPTRPETWGIAVDVPEPPAPALASLVVAAIVVALLALVGLHTIVAYAMTPAQVVTPVREAQAVGLPLPPAMALDEARIEGFRAGMATAAENGCQAPTLTTPIPPQ